MAILTAEARRRLKDSDFAVPKERKYPIHNIDHARNALSRVAEFGSPEEKKQVKAAVHKKYPSLAKDTDNDSDADGDHDGDGDDPKASSAPRGSKKPNMGNDPASPETKELNKMWRS